MYASQMMDKRVELVDRLIDVDRELTRLCGLPPSYANAAGVRVLLDDRRDILHEMRAVGYEPWPLPIDERETKVS